MLLDVGGSIVPEEKQEDNPDANRIRSGAELTVLQDTTGRTVRVVALPLRLRQERSLSLDLPLTLKQQELQVRLEEFLTAAAHWNIKEILQALSDHFDQLQFRLMALGLSKSGVKHDLRAKSDSIHKKLDPVRDAIRKAIEVHGVAGLKKALATYEQTESKLGAIPSWRRFLAIPTRRAKRDATQVIPKEVLQHKIEIKFSGGAIQTEFQASSSGADEIEEVRILQTVIDAMNVEMKDIEEKIQAIERVRVDLEQMKFPAPN